MLDLTIVGQENLVQEQPLLITEGDTCFTLHEERKVLATGEDQPPPLGHHDTGTTGNGRNTDFGQHQGSRTNCHKHADSGQRGGSDQSGHDPGGRVPAGKRSAVSHAVDGS